MVLKFGKYKGREVGEVPDTYLDHLLGEGWFIKDKRNTELAKEIVKELATRKRSDAGVPDEWGKTL